MEPDFNEQDFLDQVSARDDADADGYEPDPDDVADDQPDAEASEVPQLTTDDAIEYFRGRADMQAEEASEMYEEYCAARSLAAGVHLRRLPLVRRPLARRPRRRGAGRPGARRATRSTSGCSSGDSAPSDLPGGGDDPPPRRTSTAAVAVLKRARNLDSCASRPAWSEPSPRASAAPAPARAASGGGQHLGPKKPGKRTDLEPLSGGKRLSGNTLLLPAKCSSVSVSLNHLPPAKCSPRSVLLEHFPASAWVKL